MPPTKTLAKVGGSSKVDTSEKHSDRLTAVLSVRSNGEKLPILFIVKGTPGGFIERQEVATYPRGHVYVVQENAWMDARVWAIYLREWLLYEITGSSVILVDNLECHVSEETVDIVASELLCALEPLSKNCTSAIQPLDVGVMGPLKRRLRYMLLFEKPVFTAADKRMAMIKRTIKAWEEMSSDTVRSSFCKAIPKSLGNESH
ncbi:hypothetical protein AeMF1_000050 [Aphanomyces euteiches]|nr:hypothetical protein AeMF1_000050 [Aphanomyces euteiches]KAH9197674.1 hypothetical protein AeNC1_000375 [Aphanomyces euteiches]